MAHREVGLIALLALSIACASKEETRTQDAHVRDAQSEQNPTDGTFLDGMSDASLVDAAIVQQPPAEIAADPGFASELEDIGWHPFEVVEGLYDIADDGASPDDELALSELSPLGTRNEYGGLSETHLRTEATGFFHVERPENSSRAWLVDPQGAPFYAISVNSVFRSASAEGMEDYLNRLGDLREAARREWDRLSEGRDGSYGYRFNATLGFSNGHDVGDGLNPITEFAPYGVNLTVAASRTSSWVLRNADGEVFAGGTPLGDPFNPAYIDDLAAKWKEHVRPEDPMLITYYLGNEQGHFDWPQHIDGKPPGTLDLRPYLWSTCPPSSSPALPACASHALVAFLRERYSEDILLLNGAWQRELKSFDDILSIKPSPDATGARACIGECEQDLQRFQRVLWRKLIKSWTGTLRAMDPNHLIASPRLAVVNPRYYCFWGIPGCIAYFNDGRKVGQGAGVTYSPWRLFRRNGPYGFDVVAINAYSAPNQRAYDEPWFTRGLHKIMRESKLPVLITEFGIRGRIDGWTNTGGALSYVPNGTTAEQQESRGLYYRYDMSRFVSFRGVLGASFHRWADRYDEANQLNMGVVHRNGARWDGFDAHIKSWNSTAYARIERLTGL